MQRRAFLALAALAVSGTQAKFRLVGQRRVVFLGDSITAAGMYVDYMDAFLRTRFPKERVEILNLGLPSEGVTGLSEPDHPYPRPDLHERLERVMDRTAPDMVVACYGMNDGIYYPFTEQRFARYQAGIRKLLDRARRANAKITLLTPPPFDPVPVRGKTLPEDAFKFSWMQPFEGYDGVLERYSRWLLTLRGEGVEVVDLHGPVTAFLQELRKTREDAALSGDGVHLGDLGHLVISTALLEAWGAPRVAGSLHVDVRRQEVSDGSGSVRRVDNRGAGITWQMPIPLPPGAIMEPESAKRLRERFNEYPLRVTGLPEGRYALGEVGGKASGELRLGEFTHTELAKGVDMLGRLPSRVRYHSEHLLPLVQKRQRILASAWVTAVGHKRPDTPVGLPLDEAQRQANDLETEITRMAQPAPVAFNLVRIKD